MQTEEQQHDNSNTITHSPYYGCTVRVVSKARVSYEGILDGISKTKDRIYLKNVRVNANQATSSNRNVAMDEPNHANPSTIDTLNAVMIDHLTNDIHIYEEVCLNVRDIQELKLIELPSTFHESKAKLRALDPCLVDIRLSTSDKKDTQSNVPNREPTSDTTVANHSCNASLESTGGGDSAFVSSISDESSLSSGFNTATMSGDENDNESIDEKLEKFNELTIMKHSNAKPVTLLAKKVLPKRAERRTNTSATVSTTKHNDIHETTTNIHETSNRLTQVSNNPNNNNIVKKVPNVGCDNRKQSPIRVTVTSKLNPNAAPFYSQHRNLPLMQNSSFTFYEKPRFRPRLQTVLSSDHSHPLTQGMNGNVNHQQLKYNNLNQKHLPSRPSNNKKNFVAANQTTRTAAKSKRSSPPMISKYRMNSSTSLDVELFTQEPYTDNTLNNKQFTHPTRYGSVPIPNQFMPTPPIPERLSMTRNHPTRRSTASIRSTMSLPYQYGMSVDRNQMQTPLSLREPIGSQRGQRTISCASSCSSLSTDIGPHSIVQFDSVSSSNPLTSFEEQYDFEKANEEFRRYLELEELVIRRASPRSSNQSSADDNATDKQQMEALPYKKEISFFDRISCTATTGTAVGYTEMDETEKNLETFGDDALRMNSSFNDNELEF